MIPIVASMAPDEWYNNETYYQTKYSRWNGLVTRNPVVRQIIEIREASVFSSWAIKGPHRKEAERMLDNIRGRNGETFKQIMANLYKIAYISGDAYAEIVWDESGPEEGLIARMEILPSDNIRQIIDKGEIKRYEEIDGYGSWKPKWTSQEGTLSRIFHVRYNPRGAITHGLGMIEALNNVLVSREQLMQVGQDIYERMSQPKQMLLANTSHEDGLKLLRDAVKAAGDTWNGIAVVPGRLVDRVETLTLNPSLKPQEFLDYLDKEIFKATATPEIVLGTGYSTSEEDAKTRIAGFMGSIRYDQEIWEEDVQRQLFTQIWPTNPPEVEFSFTQEAYDAMYNRIQGSLPVIESLTNVAPENKEMMIKEKLKEMGMIT